MTFTGFDNSKMLTLKLFCGIHATTYWRCLRRRSNIQHPTSNIKLTSCQYCYSLGFKVICPSQCLSVCLFLVLPRNKLKFTWGLHLPCPPLPRPCANPATANKQPGSYRRVLFVSLGGSRRSTPGLWNQKSPLPHWEIFPLAVQLDPAAVAVLSCFK